MQNIAKVGYTTTCTGDLKQICVDLRVGYRTLKKNTNISSINKTSKFRRRKKIIPICFDNYSKLGY